MLGHLEPCIWNLAPFSFAHAPWRNLQWKAFYVIGGRGFGGLHGHHGHHGDGLHHHHLPQGLLQKIKYFGAELRRVRRARGADAAISQDFTFFMYCKIYNSPTANQLEDAIKNCLAQVPVTQWRKVFGSWYILIVILKGKNYKKYQLINQLVSYKESLKIIGLHHVLHEHSITKKASVSNFLVPVIFFPVEVILLASLQIYESFFCMNMETWQRSIFIALEHRNILFLQTQHSPYLKQIKISYTRISSSSVFFVCMWNTVRNNSTKIQYFSFFSMHHRSCLGWPTVFEL